jgi:hypothetical protein
MKNVQEKTIIDGYYICTFFSFSQFYNVALQFQAWVKGKFRKGRVYSV